MRRLIKYNNIMFIRRIRAGHGAHVCVIYLCTYVAHFVLISWEKVIFKIGVEPYIVVAVSRENII